MVRYKDFEEVSLVVDEMFTQIMQASGNITYYTIVHGTDSEVHQSSMVMVMQMIAVKIVMRMAETITFHDCDAERKPDWSTLIRNGPTRSARKAAPVTKTKKVRTTTMLRLFPMRMSLVERATAPGPRLHAQPAPKRKKRIAVELQRSAGDLHGRKT